MASNPPPSPTPPRCRPWARILRSQSGSTSIEYALLASLIATATIGSASMMGDAFSDKFVTLADSMATPSAPAGSSALPAAGGARFGPASTPNPQGSNPGAAPEPSGDGQSGASPFKPAPTTNPKVTAPQ